MKHLDKIFITDLLLPFVIGVEDWERKRKTNICINIVVSTDIQKSLKSLDLNDTVDYTLFRKEILKIAETKEYILIETLAEEIAQICLKHPLVQQVQVRVEKPNLLPFTKSVGIEIIREK